ncbi:class I SAM-dependent methyltransferase [bacterium]|nr:class I SAM-dependent methyltransferase [bacterium]
MKVDVRDQLISLIRKWDDLYREWSDLTISYCGGVHAKHRFSPREDWFRPWLGREDTVIDLGCAHGKILHALAPHIRRGIGLDHNPEHIRTARTRFQAPNIQFYEGEIESSPWPFDDRADGVILSHVLEHVEDSVGLLRRLNTRRVLILVPGTDDWISQLKHELGYDRFRDDDHKREYGREDLIREVEAAGFSVRDIRYTETGNLFCVADH